MKNLEKTNTLELDPAKLTLADYYQAIPDIRITPRFQFLEKIMEKCEVNESTARNWVAMRSRPQKESHYRILSELTGIPAENLFPAD